MQQVFMFLCLSAIIRTQRPPSSGQASHGMMQSSLAGSVDMCSNLVTCVKVLLTSCYEHLFHFDLIGRYPTTNATFLGSTPAAIQSN
jgi:hypothetical protein